MSKTVRRENARKGTKSWRIRDAQSHLGIEGYASVSSAKQGQHFTLFVSSKAKRFQVRAYRMGYYGGDLARLVWRSRWTKSRLQSQPTVSASVHMVETHWKPSLRVKVTRKWVPGDYLLKLVASDGAERYVPLTIRDPSARHSVVLVNAVTTWEAYNTWGGYDLYYGPFGEPSLRARVVSFDRPYALGEGAGGFIANELPAVALAEKLGLNVSYETDIDLGLHATWLRHQSALISLGHDEYWSGSMRSAVAGARNAGVNLAFLGANAVYRHIRFGRTHVGRDREIICYKVASEDPLYGVKNRKVTTQWRDPPVPRPESELVGALYQCSGVDAPMRVAKRVPWMMRHTHLKIGDAIPHLVLGEYDAVRAGYPTPRHIEIVFHSPLICGGHRDAADFTYYTAASNAGVIDTGTSAWVPDMWPCWRHRCKGRARLVKVMTSNILHTFALGPAGRKHPSTSDLPRFGIGLMQPVG